LPCAGFPPWGETGILRRVGCRRPAPDRRGNVPRGDAPHGRSFFNLLNGFNKSEGQRISDTDVRVSRVDAEKGGKHRGAPGQGGVLIVV